MEKNQKQLVSEHCQRDKIPNPLYICTPDKEGAPNGFFCTLTVGEHTFCTASWQKTKKSAEMEAAKLACDKLDLILSNAELKKMNTEQVRFQNPPNPPKAPVSKDPDWITIEKVEDIYKYLTDEVLAQEFKAFLHCKAQEEKKNYPAFTVTEVTDKGYVGSVTYDETTYESLGIMLTKKQAEQSAAEVCLRTLGDFPTVEKDKYTIQVYRGGQIHIPPMNKKTAYTPGVTVTQRPMYGLLHQCVGNLNLQYPTYKYKLDTSEGSQTCIAAVIFEGKTFQSQTPTPTLVEAKEQAAEEALKYLGLVEPQESHALRECIRIRKRRSYVPLGLLTSPFMYCPSKRASWVFHHFQPLDVMTGKAMTKADDTKGILEIRRSQQQSVDEIFQRAMDAEPCIGGKPVHTLTDVSIAEVNNEDKSHVIIGNKECSIQMYCEDGKIMSNKRKSAVEVLPGHNFRGLKCSYQIMYPSLQVYLKAESCDDLLYPKTGLPVVAQCGVALLIYDHEATVQDLNILLTRPSDKKTFVSKSKYLASYLNRLIATPTGVLAKYMKPSNFNVSDCISNITTWTRKECELMSAMSLDSMHELMALYVRYDDRWNEVFAKEPTDVLKELKEAALAELERRKTEGTVEEAEEPWSLPSASFQHRLHASGVFVENNLQCTFRSLLQSTGLKVKLSDLEESPVVDVPLKGDNAHRGDVCRYYVWKGIRTVSGSEEDPYYKPMDTANNELDGWTVDGDYGKRKNKRQDKPNYRQKRRFNDGERGERDVLENSVKKENGDAAAAPAEDGAQPMEEDKKPGAPTFTPNPYTKPVHDECRWFPLEEAKKSCAIVKRLATDAKFKNQVIALQLEANAFMKEKADAMVE